MIMEPDKIALAAVAISGLAVIWWACGWEVFTVIVILAIPIFALVDILSYPLFWVFEWLEERRTARRQPARKRRRGTDGAEP